MLLDDALATPFRVERAQLGEQITAVENRRREHVSVRRNDQRSRGCPVSLDERAQHPGIDERHVRQHQHRAGRIARDGSHAGADGRVHASPVVPVDDRRARRAGELGTGAVALVTEHDEHGIELRREGRRNRTAQDGRSAQLQEELVAAHPARGAGGEDDGRDAARTVTAHGWLPAR